MFSPYHTSGFYYAPVTKATLYATVASTVALNLPLSHYKHYFTSVSAESVVEKHDYLSYLTSRSVFTDPKDLLCAGILLYHFRIFERRYGSLKFASYLLGTYFLSLLLELILLFTSRQIDVIKLEPMPSGPHGLVFALFVPYFCDLPRVAVTTFMSIPVTGKSIAYLLGLQMSSDSLESTLLAICGILSGLLYRNNILCVQNFLLVPNAMATVCDKLFKNLLNTTPPPKDMEKPIGATLEIQRSERVEQLERQLAAAQLTANRNHRQPVLGGLFRGGGEGGLPQQPAVVPRNEPSEDQVRILVDMGFNRDSVLQALRVTNNDVNLATNVLLHQI